jgi:MFS family permease
MTDGAPARHDAFAAMRVPALRRFILGRIAWALGTQMLAVAVGWDVYERTGSTFALGLVGLVQLVPVLVLALPAGVFVDRHNRRDVSLAATAGHALCAFALVAIAVGAAPTWALYLVLLAIGAATAFGAPASSALYTQIVPPELFVNANAWRSTSFQLAATVGPALAGGVIALGGVVWAYALNAAAVLAFAAIIAATPRPPTPASTRGPLGEELRAGLRFMFSTRLLLAAVTLDMFAVLLGGATALLPVFAKDILHVGADGLGWLRAAPAAGALVMAVLTTRLPPWRRAGRTLLVTVVGFGASIVVFGVSRDFTLSFIALFLSGVFDNVSVVIRLTLEQIVVPESLRGRVGAVHYVFIGMSNQMGEFESGLAAALVGPIWAVVGGGIGTIAVVAWAAVKWPELRRLGALEDLKRAEDARA